MQKWRLRNKTSDISETKQPRARLATEYIETRVRSIDWWQIWRPRVNFGLLFRGAVFSTTDTSHTFCRSATKFGNVMGLTNRNLFCLYVCDVGILRPNSWMD